MAELDTNFVDAVLSANMNGKKRVRLTQIAENEYIVEDITEYEKVGSEYGQKEINTLNETVNGKVNKVEVIDDLDTVKAVTEDNVPVGCKAVTKFANDVNQSLTEKINALVQKLHPVGSWYFSTVATNPVDIFGFGTWQLVTDRFLVGAGASYFPGAMGGEAVHALTAAELPTHQHNVLSGTLGGNNGNYKFMLSPQSMYGTYDGQYGVITDDRFITAASSAYCGNQPHNNMPPYYAIYMWVRTA